MCVPEIGPVFPYGEIILWERTIQHALREACAQGSVVLDIGANMGGVAIALSRMVGDKGQVHAFECNPRLAEWARRNCIVNNVSNVCIIEKAVYSSSGRLLPFHCENSTYGHGSSLITQQHDSHEISVTTVSIDDYCAEHDVQPHAIKIDVEGAEYEVLQGALRVLRDYEPTVIYEDCGTHQLDRDPIDLLRDVGYQLYDASLYEEVNRDFYQSRPGVANVLAIPGKSRSGKGFVKRKVSVHQGMEPIRLPGGCYVIECDICGESTDTAWIKLRNLTSQVDETMYETRLNWLKHHSCSAIVFRTDIEVVVRVEVGSTSPIDGLCIASVHVFLVELA